MNRGMLGWMTRSAKRQVCRYGCCFYHYVETQIPTKIHRAREKRTWRKEI